MKRQPQPVSAVLHCKPALVAGNRSALRRRPDLDSDLAACRQFDLIVAAIRL
jgi:hypothetical protein